MHCHLHFAGVTKEQHHGGRFIAELERIATEGEVWATEQAAFYLSRWQLPCQRSGYAETTDGEATVDAVAEALARFEGNTRFRDFKAFRFAQAVAFKNRLAEQRSERSGQKLSKATLHANPPQSELPIVAEIARAVARELRSSERIG